MKQLQIEGTMFFSVVLVAILTFLLLICLSYDSRPRHKIVTAYKDFTGMLRKKGQEANWYRRNLQILERYGAIYHYGSWVEPIRFLVLRILFGLTGLLVGIHFGVLYAVLGGLVLFFLPYWMLLYLNKKDNEKMLLELKLVYHALEIQIKAGVYVTDALAECYGSVREKRLKNALLDLAGDIVMKADITDSLEKLQAKFENRYIDSLCITILQALESGQAVELLRDIGEQIKDMETAVLEKRKASLDRKITFVQLGVLTVVLGVSLFACVSYMFSTATVF